MVLDSTPKGVTQDTVANYRKGRNHQIISFLQLTKSWGTDQVLLHQKPTKHSVIHRIHLRVNSKSTVLVLVLGKGNHSRRKRAKRCRIPTQPVLKGTHRNAPCQLDSERVRPSICMTTIISVFSLRRRGNYKIKKGEHTIPQASSNTP
jgi:hypothetical protein